MSVQLPVDASRRFDVDGFLKLPGFVAGQAMRELLQHVQHFVDHVVPSMPSEHVFYEDVENCATLKQLQQMGTYDAFFADQLCGSDSPFLDVARQLLRTPVIAKNLQYFNKPPQVGRPTPPHQDGYYFMLRPPLAVTMWLSLDTIDDENGCVRYLPGSHKAGMRSHRTTQTLGFSQGIPNYPSSDEAEREVACHAAPGDLLVHDALTIHRADGNRSRHRTRRALGLIYYSEHATEDAQAKAAYQRRLTETMKAAGKL